MSADTTPRRTEDITPRPGREMTDAELIALAGSIGEQVARGKRPPAELTR